MSNTPSQVTLKFKEQVESLITEGKIANQQEVVNALNWNKSQMSQAMNGTKNIPLAVYRKFTDYYKISPPEEHIIEQGSSHSLFNLTESNRALSESNRLLALNTVELTSLVKRSFADDPKESEITVESILPGLQELLIDLGLGKYWKSKQEGQSVVSKRIFSSLKKKREGDTHVGSGKTGRS